MKTVLHLLVGLIGFMAACSAAIAQTAYPSKAVTLVVPFPPGGALDIVARALADEMRKHLGQPVIVENRAGAGGTLGTGVVARAAPDGYTVLLGSVATHAIAPGLYRNLSYDALKDFVPITQVTTSPLLVASSAKLNVATLPELIASARAQPGKVFDLARRRDEKPFFLTVSFTHPHNPYVTTAEWWDLYADDQIDSPRVPAIPYDMRDPHSQRLHWLFRQDEHSITGEDTRRARHAYYANISYVDAQIGRVLRSLAQTGLDQNTVVVFTADHGEMLGERGLWYKYTLLEPALRVPLVYRIPGYAARRCGQAVSHLDLLPTLLDLATNCRPPDPVDPLDGTSIVPLLESNSSDPGRVVAAEFTAEGAIAPMLCVRRGDYKLIVSPADPPQMFDLAADPLEMNNLAERSDLAAMRAQLQAEVDSRWDVERLRDDVLRSQRRRRWIQDQLASGDYPAWDYQPFVDASAQFVRGGGRSSPTMVKGLARFPYVEPKPPDRSRDDIAALPPALLL